MDLKHYTQLKPVNENLAISTHTLDHNDIVKTLGLTNDRIRVLAIEQMRIAKDDNNIIPRNAGEVLLILSKMAATPAEFAYLCYKTGQFDQMASPDEKSIHNFRKVTSLSPDELSGRINDILAEEGK